MERQTAHDFDQDLLVLFDAYVHDGFHNDTTPRYEAAAAKLAWERTVAFFNKNVR